ncbi:MAG: Thioredoxin reductase, partial [uncultured Thermomicrobiales bacterium]
MMTEPSSATLSRAQLATLAATGEERTAAAGEVLFRVGDASYPLIAVIEGEVSVSDVNGREVARYGPLAFLGEMDLLSGQTVFATAVASRQLRYVAVESAALRELMSEDGPLSDLLLSTFIARREALQQVPGVGVEVIGTRQGTDTRRILDFARRLGIAFTWRDPDSDDEAARLLSRLAPDEVPLIRVPGGRELRGPTNGELSRALGIGLELEPQEDVDLLIIGAGPAGLGAAVYAASEGLDTLVVERTGLGGQASVSRRIENYLGFPAGISGTELSSRAVAQARKFNARTATPYRALALEPGEDRHVVRLDDDRAVRARAVLIATGADYRRLDVPDLERYEGL